MAQFANQHISNTSWAMAVLECLFPSLMQAISAAVIPLMPIFDM